MLSWEINQLVTCIRYVEEQACRSECKKTKSKEKAASYAARSSNMNSWKFLYGLHKLSIHDLLEWSLLSLKFPLVHLYYILMAMYYIMHLPRRDLFY